MTISLTEITDYLKKEQISYIAHIPDHWSDDTPLTFASAKHLIPKGFYFVDRQYLAIINALRDSVILTNAEHLAGDSNVILVVDNPQLIHYKLAAAFTKLPNKGIHKTAIVSEEAIVHESAYIGPYCILEACEIGPHVQLLGHVTVRKNVTIKAHSIIEGNSVIGARGMAWIWDEDGTRIMQPQTGGVIIGEHCTIGTDISIVRGSLTENTQIGDHTIIAHGTKIGHGSQIDPYVHIANNVSLAGNAHIGERTFLGSACTVSSNVRIAPNCIVGAGAVVSKSIEQEYATIVGVPAKVIKVDNYKDKPKGAPKPFKK